eukprot:CAMPEP_0198713698 /NCGR_PEP_ID=MMETSP1471-20131121/7741_1 /TAXON_ID=41880 /ORGANISM="Pycnococcus provasolii, Strain RCC733" /LENGTH=58 /DNA_ID=CAMNT_0044473827 /DNA_START=10 /DNA_END=186 /DNA_ORIENTATION=+
MDIFFTGVPDEAEAEADESAASERACKDDDRRERERKDVRQGGARAEIFIEVDAILLL